MTELTFSADLYDEPALLAAVAAYARVASCQVESGSGVFRVQLSATGRIEEDRIVSEFCNYTLGATVEGRRIAPRVRESAGA